MTEPPSDSTVLACHRLDELLRRLRVPSADTDVDDGIDLAGNLVAVTVRCPLFHKFLRFPLGRMICVRQYEASKRISWDHFRQALTLDDVIVRIKKSYTYPNVRSIPEVVLKEGPRAFRIPMLMELVKPLTNEFHHYQLEID
jgi:hypothetical protein